MHGQRLDNAVERVEGVVARVLRGIARTIAALVGSSPSTAALSDDDLQPIRQVWEKAVGEDILPAVGEAYAESARTLAVEFVDAGRPTEPLTLDAPEAADFLDAATSRLVGVSDTLWEIARKEFADGVRAGEGVEELAARLQEAGGFGIARARMIARTEVVAASNAASLAQALRLGDASMMKVWMDSDDDRVRAGHEAADGQAVPVAETFDVGGEALSYPAQPVGSAGNVINCFPGDVEVTSCGSLRKVYRRWYEGVLVRVDTASGVNLSGTPNHPVLTDTGWKPLQLLNLGDKLIKASVSQGMGGRDPEIGDTPTQFAEVYRAATKAGMPDRIIGSGVDFHGDGTDREVDVVAFDGDLSTPSRKSDGNFVFVGIGDTEAPLASRGHLASPLGVDVLPQVREPKILAPSLMRRRSPFATLLGGGAVKTDTGCVSPSPDLDAALNESEPNCAPTHFEVFSQSLLGHPVSVKAGNLGTVHASPTLRVGGRRGCINSSLPQPLPDGHGAGVDAIADLFESEPLTFQFDEVTDVEIRPFSGHVYNLETDRGVYLANSIVASNCRCTLAYEIADTLMDEIGDEPLTAAAEVHTGAMVALRPTAEDADRLAVEGGEPADQLHCTQAYLGEAADIPPEVQRAIIDRLSALVEDAIRPDYDLPLMVDGFAVSMFNPPGAEHPDGRDRSSCVVLGLSGDDLDGIHKMIVSTVEEVYAEHGLEMPAQHAPYNAHLTLEYTDDPHRVEELMDRAGPVTFDAIRVAFGGENTDIPLRPVVPQVAAASPTDSPEHVGGVDLPDGAVQVDAWADGTFSISDPSGDGLWLDEDEANDLIDALNQVRSGGAATTIDIGPGGLEVAVGDAGNVQLVPQDEADGWALSDDDAYELSYWLAYWLDRADYYNDEALIAARVWDPLKHPRGPDGRFIGKGIVGRASGDTGKSKVTRRTDPPAALPRRPSAPEDPRRAELSKLRVAELRRQARDAELKPGRARKAELIDMLAERGSAAPVEPVPDAPSQQQADAGPQVLSPSGQEMRSVLQDRSLEELQDTAADVGIDPGDSSRDRLAVRLASVLAGGPDPIGPISVRAAGSDQTDALSADLDQDRAGFDARSKAAFNAPYDLHLEWLTERAGFNARPQVASREELDAAVSAGWSEVWRGVTNGDGKTASEINAGLREGAFEPGRGNYGNGVYTSTRRNTAETYRGVEPRVNHPTRGDDFTPDELEGDPPPDSLLRIAIDPTARVGDYDQLLAELNEWRSGRPSATPSADTFADVGRYATARGYDVVRVVGHDDGGFYPGWEESDGDEPGADQYVILNRSAIMIQRPEDAL